MDQKSLLKKLGLGWISKTDKILVTCGGEARIKARPDRLRALGGGRIGYPKQELFFWLLFKKSMGLDYRTVPDMAGVAHSTLIRVNCKFSKAGIYHKFLIFLVKLACKGGLIPGKKVAMNASFVKTYTKKEEHGSLGWNGYKDGFGFKLHALIDAETGVLIVERFFSTLKRVFHLGQGKTRRVKTFLENTYLSCIRFMLKKLWIAGVI